MNKEQRLIQQIVMIRHLCPLRIFASFLFGLGAKIEIRVQAPILDRPDFIDENRSNVASYFGESLFPRCSIGEDDTKKNGRLTGRVFTQAIRNVDSLRTELAHCALDLGVKLPLMDESAWNHWHTPLSRDSKGVVCLPCPESSTVSVVRSENGAEKRCRGRNAQGVRGRVVIRRTFVASRKAAPDTRPLPDDDGAGPGMAAAVAAM